MDDSIMSYSATGSWINTATHWIDSDLVTDGALSDFMGSCYSLPYNRLDFGTNSSADEHSVGSDNFELHTWFRGGQVLAELAREPAVDKIKTTTKAQSALELTLFEDNPIEPELAKVKKDRRRAQNRKSQQAFRKRKDTAIARVERQMESLLSINDSLSQINKAHFQEILDLKNRLRAHWLAPLSSVVDGQDSGEGKSAGCSPHSCNSPPAEEPMGANTAPRPTDGMARASLS